MVNTYAVELMRTQMFIEQTLALTQLAMIGSFYVLGLVIISWQFVIALGVLAMIAGFTSGKISRRIEDVVAQSAGAKHRLMGYVGDVFGAFRVIRASGAEEQCSGRFEKFNREATLSDTRAIFLSGTLFPTTEATVVMGTVFLLVQTDIWLIRSGRLTTDSLMVLGVWLVRLFPALNQFYNILGQSPYFTGGVRELIKWLNVPRFSSRSFGTLALGRIQKSIRLDRLSVEYPGGKRALDDLTLEIPAGSTVALVGSSGSGKTTLASILLRLREPTSGTIFVDGIDYWMFSRESWHACVRMVEQGALLMNDTIRANITLGTPHYSESQLKKALSMAHLDSVIAALPDGVDSPVGERGSLLSGGQRQRVAIARAMLRDPQVLVLDEATSALDNASEREIQTALHQAREGRTAIVIAHRLGTVRTADLIVVLEHGRVVQQGTWDELSSVSGRFSQLLAAGAIGDQTESS